MATPDRKLRTRWDRSLLHLRIFACISLCALVLVARVQAQTYAEVPPAAAYGPSYDVNAGTSYLSTQIPSAGRLNLYGLDAGGRIGFRPRWGVAADAAYVRASNVFGTGHSSYVLTALAGPVFYPLEGRKTRAFLHGMVGAGLVDSAFPVSGGQYLHGYVERPAYMAGGGMERSLFGPFGFRFSGDYLRTAYANVNQTIQMQNNLRLTGSFVYRIHDRLR